MKLVDTVVILGSLNTGSGLHRQCVSHLDGLAEDRETFVPTSTLLEADLVMKGRGYSLEEREVTWRALEHRIPLEKTVANSLSSIRGALPLQEKGLDYFDSLICSLAIELGARVVTTDQAIRLVADTEW